jgi:hypothetical protein
MDRGILDCRTRQFSDFWLVTRKAPAGSQTPNRGMTKNITTLV